MELGILLSVATAMTSELKILANKTPLATATEVNRINFFMVGVFYLNKDKNICGMGSWFYCSRLKLKDPLQF